MTRPGNAPSYDEDFVAWLEDQARRARRGEAGELDLENIAEELEGMARSDRREIRDRLIVLLIHLLKYSAQPRRCSSGWLAAIGEQRSRIATVIDDNPTLKSFPGRYWSTATLTHARAPLLRPACLKATFRSAVRSR